MHSIGHGLLGETWATTVGSETIGGRRPGPQPPGHLLWTPSLQQVEAHRDMPPPSTMGPCGWGMFYLGDMVVYSKFRAGLQEISCDSVDTE